MTRRHSSSYSSTKRLYLGFFFFLSLHSLIGDKVHAFSGQSVVGRSIDITTTKAFFDEDIKRKAKRITNVYETTNKSNACVASDAQSGNRKFEYYGVDSREFSMELARDMHVGLNSGSKSDPSGSSASLLDFQSDISRVSSTSYSADRSFGKIVHKVWNNVERYRVECLTQEVNEVVLKVKAAASQVGKAAAVAQANLFEGYAASSDFLRDVAKLAMHGKRMLGSYHERHLDSKDSMLWQEYLGFLATHGTHLITAVTSGGFYEIALSQLKRNNSSSQSARQAVVASAKLIHEAFLNGNYLRNQNVVQKVRESELIVSTYIVGGSGTYAATLGSQLAELASLSFDKQNGNSGSSSNSKGKKKSRKENGENNGQEGASRDSEATDDRDSNRSENGSDTNGNNNENDQGGGNDVDSDGGYGYQRRALRSQISETTELVTAWSNSVSPQNAEMISGEYQSWAETLRPLSRSIGDNLEKAIKVYIGQKMSFKCDVQAWNERQLMCMAPDKKSTFLNQWIAIHNARNTHCLHLDLQATPFQLKLLPVQQKRCTKFQFTQDSHGSYLAKVVAGPQQPGQYLAFDRLGKGFFLTSSKMESNYMVFTEQGLIRLASKHDEDDYYLRYDDENDSGSTSGPNGSGGSVTFVVNNEGIDSTRQLNFVYNFKKVGLEKHELKTIEEDESNPTREITALLVTRDPTFHGHCADWAAQGLAAVGQYAYMNPHCKPNVASQNWIFRNGFLISKVNIEHKEEDKEGMDTATSSYCLQVDVRTREVTMAVCDEGRNQKWIRTEQKAFVSSMEALKGSCLDVAKGVFARSLRLGMYPCHGGTNQQFEFRQISTH